MNFWSFLILQSETIWIFKYASFRVNPVNYWTIPAMIPKTASIYTIQWKYATLHYTIFTITDIYKYNWILDYRLRCAKQGSAFSFQRELLVLAKWVFKIFGRVAFRSVSKEYIRFLLLLKFLNTAERRVTNLNVLKKNLHSVFS